jgi:mitochondrial chaperone BCS1
VRSATIRVATIHFRRGSSAAHLEQGFFVDFFSNISVHDLWLEVRKTLDANQFAQGGLMLMVLGGAVAYLRNLPRQMFNWCFERLVVTMQVDSKDKSFEWFQVWLSQQRVSGKMRDLALQTRHGLEGGFDVTEDEGAPKALLSPVDGTFYVRFAGRLFWFTASRERMQGNNSLLIGFHETLRIRTLFTNRAVLQALVAAAYRAVCKPEEPRVDILTPRWDDWNVAQRVVPRAPESLVYAHGLFERTLADAQKFLASERWYADMGIPWRRGYLLYGPPGNGKSSLITALAGVLKRSVCVLNLSSLTITDEAVTNLLSAAPDGSIVLLEDVDAVFSGRERSSGNDSKLSFNGLLNALDGVTAQQGRMVFMTTNHLEKLDAALVRPGRCDVHQFIGNATREQITRMLQRFYTDLEPHTAHDLADRIEEGALSMARVQEFLVRHREDLSGAITGWHELERVAVHA